jgi:putative ABC transport system permease protein
MRINQLFRSLLRDRLNTSVVIISLAVGLSCFNLIIMFINRELRTDSFQNRKDQIYALKCDDPWFPGKKIYYCKFGSAEYMKANFPQVEDFCRITNSGSQKIVINNEIYYDQPAIIRTSINFFSFFSYKLLTNNPATALESKNNIVISDELAKKYFGSEDAMGKVIEIVNSNKTDKLVVSGVFKKPVDNSQLVFDMVRPIGESDSRCYIRLAKQSKKDEMEKLFLEKKEFIPVINVGTPVPYYLEPLSKAYFDTTRGSAVEASRDITDLWVALVIGIMILGIATFNYLGILSNKFLVRIKEFKIRHVNGGSRFSIIFRFMLENSILIGFSYLVSLYIMIELIPFFNKLTGSAITEKFILQPEQILIFMAVIAFIWIITLLYVTYLVYAEVKNNFIKAEQTSQVKSVQIPVLNIFQIASSIALIICSIIIIEQMKFIQNKTIGLDKNVIEVRLPGQYSDKVSVFKDELMKNKSISCISIVGASPVLEHFLVSLKYEQDGVEKQYSPAGFSGDENYLKVLGIQLIKGDNFSENQSGNSKRCLINQSFANLFQGQDLIGKGMPGMEDMIITGIVNDFNYSSLKSWVEPAFISFSSKGSHLLVKASDSQTVQARKAISLVWHELIPDFPVNIESVGDRYEWFHRENKNYIKLMLSCSFISLFLSMIGLFTISFQRARSRTKEIGIRKINGASILEILAILNKDFGRWILLAIVFAVPVAWYAMNKWLQNYAYKIEISWWVFALAGAITLGIALLTVSWQSWWAATRNPVEALRYE